MIWFSVKTLNKLNHFPFKNLCQTIKLYHLLRLNVSWSAVASIWSFSYIKTFSKTLSSQSSRYIWRWIIISSRLQFDFKPVRYSWRHWIDSKEEHSIRYRWDLRFDPMMSKFSSKWIRFVDLSMPWKSHLTPTLSDSVYIIIKKSFFRLK